MEPSYYDFQEEWQPPVKRRKRRESPFADSPYIMAWQTEAKAETQAAVPVPEKEKKGGAGRFFRRLLCTILIFALVAACCGITVQYLNRRWERKLSIFYDSLNDAISGVEKRMNRHTEEKKDPSEEPQTGEKTPAQVYAENVGAVVSVSGNGTVTDDAGTQQTVVSFGSGFVLTEDGYIVTNYHVVSSVSACSVIFFDGTKYAATLVGYDDADDIALLKIEASALPCVTLGSSEALAVGDTVVAIGNALGEMSPTLTVGYISAKDRRVDADGSIKRLLQTDAIINSGSSGGVLLNMDGEVVGITNAKYSGTTSDGAVIEGTSFAIPIDDVKDVLEDLRLLGYVRSGYLGVTVRDIDTAEMEQFGLPEGALVINVADGSAAQKAGICVDDVIVSLDENPVDSVNALHRALRKYRGGDTAVISVFRGGERTALPIVLDGELRK